VIYAVNDRLFKDSIAAATTAGFLEVGAFLKLTLLAGIKGFHRTVVAHDAGINSAFGAFRFVLGEDLLVGFNYGFDFCIAHNVGMNVMCWGRSIRTEEAQVALRRVLLQEALHRKAGNNRGGL